MFGSGKLKYLQNAIISSISLVLATTTFSAALNSARIIPAGKVSNIKDGKVIGEYSREAPLPEGSLLRCEARCTAKLDDLYMVAEPETIFSVAQQTTANELTVQQGTVYYSLHKTSRPLQINTPPGDASIRKVSVTDSELRGYVQVSDSTAEIGVIDGGTIVVETSAGEMAITPGKQVTIASVNNLNPSAVTAAATREGGGSGVVTDIVLGAAQAGVIIGGGYALYAIDQHFNSGSNNDDDDGSPSSP